MFIVVCAGAVAAEATCIETGGGCSVCCSGPGECHESCPEPTTLWQERDAGAANDPKSSRIEVAVGGVGASTMDLDVSAGVRLSLGYHRLRPFNNRNIDDAPRPRGAWCAPLLLCGGGGITAMPTSAVAGNERGVDLTVEHTRGAGEPRTTFGLRPVLRVARPSRIRTASFIGVMLPEVGAVLRGSAFDGLLLRWSPYPIDVRVTNLLALSLEPIAFAATFTADGVRWTMSSTLALTAVL